MLVRKVTKDTFQISIWTHFLSFTDVLTIGIRHLDNLIKAAKPKDTEIAFFN